MVQQGVLDLDRCRDLCFPAVQVLQLIVTVKPMVGLVWFPPLRVPAGGSVRYMHAPVMAQMIDSVHSRCLVEVWISRSSTGPSAGWPWGANFPKWCEQTELQFECHRSCGVPSTCRCPVRSGATLHMRMDARAAGPCHQADRRSGMHATAERTCKKWYACACLHAGAATTSTWLGSYGAPT